MDKVKRKEDGRKRGKTGRKQGSCGVSDGERGKIVGTETETETETRVQAAPSPKIQNPATRNGKIQATAIRRDLNADGRIQQMIARSTRR